MTDPTDPTKSTAEATAPPSGILARSQKSVGRARGGAEGWVWSIREEVAELLTGSPFEVDSYLQNAYRVVSESAQLKAAANESGHTVLGAIMLGATLQLPIGGPLGQFYLTPRTDRSRKVCVPMIGYRGFFELGYRSGNIRHYGYVIRREGDTWRSGASSERGEFFDFEQYENGEFDELDENGTVRPLTGVLALAYPVLGERPAFKFMSKAAIDRRKPTRTQNTPWEGKDREAMYVKTPHRELAKFLQLSIATAKAVQADETISYLNRATGAIETLPPDEEAPAQVEAGDTAPPAAPQEESGVSGRRENPDSADRRTAPTDDAAPADDDPEYRAWLESQQP